MWLSRNQINSSVAGGVVLLALASHAFGQAGQNPKPAESDDVVRVFSELVQTDVMVFDKQGRFVNGMKREDFQLQIDGKPRSVEFFERISAGSSNEETQLAAARGSSVTGTVPLDRGRSTFFYIDDFHLSTGSMFETRKLLSRFVDQDLGQNDEAAITSASGQIGFLQQLSDNKAVLRAAIARLTERTVGIHDVELPPMSEYQALQIDHNDRDLLSFYVEVIMRQSPGLALSIAEQEVQARATQILQQGGRATTLTLAGLESLVRSSAKLPGRKLIFFISDGFFIDDHNADVSDKLRKITSAAARTGTMIYSVDARGLVASLTGAGSNVAFDLTGRLERSAHGELMATQDAMHALARNTGGRAIINTNALDVAITQALKETSVYYLLAWKPEHETQQGSNKFRRLQVSLVGHPELTVRVRQGFYDVDSSGPTGRPKVKPQPEKVANSQPPKPEEMLREELAAASPRTDLPVAMNLTFLNTDDKGAMLVASMRVPTASLAFTNEEAKLKGQVDIAGVVYNDKGKVGGRFGDRLTATTESVDQLRASNKELVYNYRIYLPPGIYQVRVGGRDAGTGIVGTAFAWIEIPNLSQHQLALSSLIIGERLPENMHATNTDPKAIAVATVRVDHRFHRGSGLRFIVYVYNAGLSPTDSKPDLALQLQVLRDGQPVITTPSKKISSEGLEQLKQIPYGADVPLEGLLPGRYVLQVSVVDRVSKSSASQQLRFEIQ